MAMNLVIGSRMEYYSVSNHCWVPVTIVHVDDESGAAELDMVPPTVIELREQHIRLRPLSKPSQAQLEYVRAVLREGRLEEEAQKIFARHARPGGGADPGMALCPEGALAAAAELDRKLGTCGTICKIKSQMKSASCPALTLDGFGELFWQLMWGVHKEFCHAVSRNDVAPRPGFNPDQVYAFEKVLGKGTYGSVQLATERSSGAKRAIKLISKKDHNWNSTYQLDCEIAHLRHLDHPHIVKLYEHYEDSNYIYIVMDYCCGGDLQTTITETRAARCSIPETFVSDVMRQVMMAIAHVHSCGIIHLDLKSANIMLMPSKRTLLPGRASNGHTLARIHERPHVMVIDLGVAQIFQPGNFRRNKPMGTPATMAPEVWKGEITPKADIFSCGVVLFEQLSLGLPFPCPCEVDRAVRYWGRHPEVPWGWVEQSSNLAVGLCRRMLLLNRYKRPAAPECLQTPFLLQGLPAEERGEAAARAPPEVLRRLAGAQKRSVLYRTVALSIARVWPSNQMPTIKRLFLGLDTAGTGRLSKAQISDTLEAFGVGTNCAHMAADAMDLNRDGIIEWTEFVAACIELGDDIYDEDLERIFKRADSDSDGLLSQKDMSDLLTADHLRRGDAVRDLFVELVGRAEEGTRIDWPTFRRHFQGGAPGGAKTAVLGCGGAGPVSAAVVVEAVKADVADLCAQARALFDRTWDALWPEKADHGEPPEELVQQLVDMGFTSRETCIAVLKKYRNDLSTRVVDELLRTHAR